MKSKSLLISVVGVPGVLGIAAVIVIAFICPTHQVIVPAETQSSNAFKNLHEFLENTFDGRVLEFNFNNLTQSDTISKVRSLQAKLRKSNSSNEVMITTLNSMKKSPNIQ